MVDFRPQNLKKKVVDNLQFRLARNVIKMADYLRFGQDRARQYNLLFSIITS